MVRQLTNIARQLRKKSTPQESKLWAILRNQDFDGLKFRRQYVIENYIVDFCCPEKRLIIELDGGGHNQKEQLELDKVRDKYLNDQGFKVLRIWNNDIDNNLEGVLEKILELTKR